MKIAYDRTGSGPPLVLLHPLGSDRHVWDPIIERLAAQRTVVAIDLPGFGESPPLAGVEPSPQALADAVAVEIERLQLSCPHVAGNSLGGWVALELGLRTLPARVTAIAPAGLWPAPLVPKAGWAHRLARALEPVAVAAVATAAGRRALLAGSMAHPERMSPRDAAHLLRAYARAPGFVAVNDAMRARTFTGLGQIRCPVTLVWPDRDRLVERPERVPDSVRESELVDAGHIPMWDAPEAVATVLLQS